MPDKVNNLQDMFLNSLRRTKTPVTMFLVKGVKLQGIVTWFDNFSVLLRRDGQRSWSTSTRSRRSCPASRSMLGVLQRAFDERLEKKQPPAAGGVPQPRSARPTSQVTMFLVNGVMLQGEIAAFDLFCMLLERDGLVPARLQARRLDDPAGNPVNFAEDQAEE